MPLGEFTKTFNLQELKKGWFPRKFNNPENLEYEGTIPDLDYYEPQDMKSSKKDALKKWHAEQVLNGDVWNMRNEMLEYCKSAVRLMKEGCMWFSSDFENESGFNPLTKCITIASACHHYWRNLIMEPNTIAIEPLTGWGGLKTSQSSVAFQ